MQINLVSRQTAIADALAFYRFDRCMLTGKEPIQWHHLDENSGMSYAENLVPIESRFNDVIERRRKNPDRPFPEELSFDRLAERSKIAFDCGEFRASYGTSRLGCFLASSYGDPELQLGFAAGALTSLRPAPVLSYVADTLSRSVLPVLRSNKASRVGRLPRFRLAIEIAALCRDFDQHQIAVSMLDSKAAMAPPDEGAFHLSRAEHCRATSEIFINPQGADVILDRANKFAQDSDFPFGISSVNASRVNIALQKGNLAEAEVQLHHAFKYAGGYRGNKALITIRPPQSLVNCSWWIASDLLASKADLEFKMGHKESGRDFAGHALQLLVWTGITPRHEIAARLEQVSYSTFPRAIHPNGRDSTDLKTIMPLLTEVLSELGRDL
jgi:hypothetical protein